MHGYGGGAGDGELQDPREPLEVRGEARDETRALVSALAACLLFVAARAAWRVDYGKHTLELIRWLRRDVSTQLGCSILATLTAVATPMLLTTTPLNVGAGAVYGVFLGSLVSRVGATGRAPFCVRWRARFSPERVGAAENQRQPAVDVAGPRRDETRGAAGIVMLSRLSPMFPFAACSFAFGACRVSASDFLAGTLAGLAPGTAMTSYIGWNLYDVTKLKSEASEVDSDEATHRGTHHGSAAFATRRLCARWRDGTHISVAAPARACTTSSRNAGANRRRPADPGSAAV